MYDSFLSFVATIQFLLLLDLSYSFGFCLQTQPTLAMDVENIDLKT
jgi:hypothetical protein